MNLENNKKRVAVLGSTGSIGTQTLEVIANQTKDLQLEVLSAFNNAELLIEQAIKYSPNAVVIGNDAHYLKVKEALAKTDIKVFAGEQALCEIVAWDTIDIVLTSMVGYAGLKPTLAAIEAGKNIALANKETLVVAGDLVTKLALQKGVNIYPVDSEHSAIFQCLAGEFDNQIEKIYLTASGGPFRGRKTDELKQITKAQALKHPNWVMGAKITIDSASLMNKGLEVIEAKWLFALKNEQIDVIVHPQSIIHSMVQFTDGSIKAQLGLPDMKLPIQYALSYPARFKNDFPRFNFDLYSQYTFEKPDIETFRNLQLTFYAHEKAGNMPCILNASNEIAVAKFLNDEVGFLEMSDLIEDAMQRINFVDQPSYDDYVATDHATRILTQEWKSKKVF